MQFVYLLLEQGGGKDQGEKKCWLKYAENTYTKCITWNWKHPMLT
jgi:hypothetical protein